MGYHVALGKSIIGTLGADNIVNYDMKVVDKVIKEMVAGQSPGTYFTTAKVIYRWDRNRKANNEAVFKMWKANPLIQNRIVIMNALVFGKGLKWLYDPTIQPVINRFWRTNRLNLKLDSINTDCQLYGEIFIGLYPQPSGDVIMATYEANQVEVDFKPGNINDVNKYIVSYKDEESGKDVREDLMPLDKYLNEIEYSTPVTISATASKSTLGGNNVGLNGAAKVKGKGVMVHLKFNNSTAEVYGTSDFKQVFDILPDYMNFVGDRLTIHQMYGSPAYDITIDTDDPEIITNRITELAGFTIGSNPVHNKSEEWKPLEFTQGGLIPDGDEKMIKGLLCAGTSFPEHLLFNQASSRFDDNTFSVVKLAENRQEAYKNAFSDIHKFVVAIAGGDILVVDDGQLIFPEVDVMSEKSKAETYVLKVGANICSRQTAATNMGHNWKFEEDQILEEFETFGDLLSNNSFMGAMAGRFNGKEGNQEPGADDGSEGKADRMKMKTITTQTMGNRKKS